MNRILGVFALAVGTILIFGSGAVAIAQESQPVEASDSPTADFPEAKFVETNGIRMAYYEKGEGIPVVFSHGFPELGYSWRYQLDALAAAGYRAIAPDQRGYGQTDRPEAIDQYTINHLCDDLAGLLDALEIEKAIFCGHDWGGFVVWSMALLHPDRVAGVIGVNTPFLGRPAIPPIELITQMRGEDNYMVFFQEPGRAEEFMERDYRGLFVRMLRKNALTKESLAELSPETRNLSFEAMWETPEDELQGEPLVSDEELEYYVETFTRTGLSGGLNWYRNLDRNWELTEGVEQLVKVPSMMVSADLDIFLPPALTFGMERYVPDLELHIIENCGHWTQQEKAGELNALMIEWLGRRFGGGAE